MRLRWGLVLLLLASRAEAEVPTLAASVGYASELFTARAYDFVATSDGLPMVRLATSTSLELAPWRVDVELGYQSGSTDAFVHSTVRTELWLRGLELGATFRYPRWRHLHPYARLGAGWDWATLSVSGQSGLAQTTGNLSGRGLVGAQLVLPLAPRGWRAPALVFDLGAGYVLRPAYEFHALTRSGGGDDPVAQAPVDLGSLPLSGPTVRLMLSLRY